MGYPSDYKFKKKFTNVHAHNAMMEGNWQPERKNLVPERVNRRIIGDKADRGTIPRNDTFINPAVPHFIPQQYNKIMKMLDGENTPPTKGPLRENMEGSVHTHAFLVDSIKKRHG